MSEPKPSLEIIAPSIEEAITRGAEEFGIPREELSVEILDEGTRGFLGLGTRQARVRLTIREGYEGEIPELPEVITEVEQVVPVPDVRVEEPESDDAEALEISKSTVVELLDKMGIVAEVTARWGEKDDKSRIIPLHIDVTGSDLSILIGRKGETLTALQYISRLIVGKELRRPIAIVIDVEGYRARREQQLRQLARRMAQQTIERGRSMSLEPMPPNERRIIHIELRDHPQVYTESVGEADRRKVTILLRQEQD
jgi:spoIIIJ-associated protein